MHDIGGFRGVSRYFGAAIPPFGVGAVAVSSLAVEPTPVHLLAGLLVALGVYDLVTNGFLSLLRAAAILTAGIGLHLLALEAVSMWEFVRLWPAALITFGLIVLLSDAFEGRRRRRSMPG